MTVCGLALARPQAAQETTVALIAIVFGYMMTLLGGLVYAASVYRGLYGPMLEEAVPAGNPWLRPLTALIPAIFGIALVILGTIAGRSSNERTRMHVMHGAALVGLLGLLLPLIRLAIVFARGQTPGVLPLTGSVVLALLSAAFLILCVNSFIATRRARKQSEQQSTPPLPG
jgi:hypothetical protein